MVYFHIFIRCILAFLIPEIDREMNSFINNIYDLSAASDCDIGSFWGYLVYSAGSLSFISFCRGEGVFGLSSP